MPHQLAEQLPSAHGVLPHGKEDNKDSVSGASSMYRASKSDVNIQATTPAHTADPSRWDIVPLRSHRKGWRDLEVQWVWRLKRKSRESARQP